MFKQKNVISSQSAFCFILRTLRQNSENTFPNNEPFNAEFGKTNDMKV